MAHRNYTSADRFIIQLDQLVSSVFPRPAGTTAASPADLLAEQPLNRAERQRSAGLMRVNHAGEVAAQALYQAQALTAHDPVVRQEMEQAASDENNHLAWCKQRVTELGGNTSLLDPVWYLGAFSIGSMAGLAGDKWSLGFLAETEKQVVVHLQAHLEKLPENDLKSRAIVEQMTADEARHGEHATVTGGVALPAFVKNLMQLCSGVMTRTAYRV